MTVFNFSGRPLSGWAQKLINLGLVQMAMAVDSSDLWA